MTKPLHILKLCVGAERVEDLIDWQKTPQSRGADGSPRHVTRMWPKRSEEILSGGSLYWVFKGVILARQRIVRLDEVQCHDGVVRCGLVLDPEIIRTQAAPRRPFQGWRYLAADEAPPDLRHLKAGEATLPPELSRALADIGVL